MTPHCTFGKAQRHSFFCGKLSSSTQETEFLPAILSLLDCWINVKPEDAILPDPCGTEDTWGTLIVWNLQSYN